MGRQSVPNAGREFRSWRVLPIVLLTALSAEAVGARMLDLNNNGMSDVWEALYGAVGLAPTGDANGDGTSNLQKSIAGADPFASNSFPKLSVALSGTNVFVSLPGALGKRYEFQSFGDLGGGSNWVIETSFIARTGTVAALTAPANAVAKFFRVAIADVDSDGDGLTDWEEYQLGLDPLQAYSNGQTNANGQPINDYTYVTSAFQNAVTIRATGPIAVAPAAGQTTGSPGAFTVTRSGFPLNSITVNLAPAAPGPGIASEGLDYAALPRSLTFPPGVSAQVIPLTPLANPTLPAPALATLSLGAGAGYSLGTGSNASVVVYPASAQPTAPGITSPLTAIAFLAQPFSFRVTATNAAAVYLTSPLPPGLAFNATNQVISGTPSVAGDFQLTLAASNAVAVAASVVNLQVVDAGGTPVTGQVTREIWLGVAGTNVTDIPASQGATIVATLGTLEGISNYGDNYGERIRGYLTPPVTGTYRFWVAGSDSAELWISGDGEAASKVRRAYVLPSANPAPPPLRGTAPRQWNLQPNQQSAWLSLAAGQKYYVEVLHKAGTGTNDNWAVGWVQDSAATNTTPAGVVPGELLSPYYAPPVAVLPGTLYAANLLAQGTVASLAVGTATLRLSADESQAVLRFSYSGLSSPRTGEHIHSDPYLSNPSQVLFDIDTATPQADGSYLWNLGPVGTLSAADIVEIIKEGKAFINIHTANYPAGEISGHFTLVTGTQEFTPPPAPPSWADDHTNANAAARFLVQATFGPTLTQISNVQTLGYEGWLDQQFSLPPSRHLPYVLAGGNGDTPGAMAFNSWWQQSVTAPDQLRQRVAFALSEIFVVSQPPVEGGDSALSAYYDKLLEHSFGNFRDLLKAVTLSPMMGIYLNMQGNDKENPALGTHPNENYAREVMQLFSLGLNRKWPDGSLVLDSKGNLMPTYDQNVIMGLARVFTGWNFYQPNQSNGRLPTYWYPAPHYTNSMVLVPTHHETGAKLLLDNVILPAAQGSQADPASPDYDSYGQQELDTALDLLFNHQNVGPFICRQLIQRLVTSNPSRDYLYRVAQTFNDNGSGVRGDLRAVVKAILLDYEARGGSLVGQSTYGKQREPVLRATAPARAFAPAGGGGSASTWHLGLTDSYLTQTPLRSPTVFNFFTPDYKFPGALASAGLTTPEFQLTTEMTVVNQMNFLTGGTLVGMNATNGFSSFASGNGSILMDLGPWMTTNYTATADGLGTLVDNLNTLLLAGQLSANARSVITNYVGNPANFPYTSPPAFSQISDRVRAAVHLILTSPDFTIQK